MFCPAVRESSLFGVKADVPNKEGAGANIGDLLLREGLITNAQLEMALAHQRQTEKPLLRILAESGALEETKRLNFFKRQFGIPLVSLAAHSIDPLLYTYIPASIARKHHLVPIKLDRDGLVVAMEDPSDLVLLDNLKEIVGIRVKPVVAMSDEISEALGGYPEERTEQAVAAKRETFDTAARFFSAAFLPVISAAALVAVFGLLWFNRGFQAWIRDQQLDWFTRFLYIFLTWGVWTIVMFEVRGLVFDDMQWRSDEEVGEGKKRGTALLLSIFLGWLGIDRFYLGYRAHGILKLCTFGLFGLWWLLDIFLLFGRDIPDAAGRELA
jgi:hypothetical protein